MTTASYKLWTGALFCVGIFIFTDPLHAQRVIDYERAEVDKTNYVLRDQGETTFLQVLEGVAAQWGKLSGPGSVEKIGSGQLLLTSTNTYSGGTFVKEGALEISGPRATLVHRDSAVTVGNGASFLVTGGGDTQSRSLVLSPTDGSASAVVSGGSFDGTLFQPSRLTVEDLTVGIFGGGSFIVTDGGLASSTRGEVVAGSSATVLGGSSYGGSAHPSAWNNSGDLSVGGTLTIASSGTVVVGEGAGVIHLQGDAATLNIGSHDIPSSSGALVAAEVAGNGTVAFNQTDELFFSPKISGNARVAQRGSGTTTIASGTYSGGTTVNGGKLVAGGEHAVGSGDVKITGGTFDTGGNVLGNNVSMTGGTLRGGGTLGNVDASGGALAPNGLLKVGSLTLGSASVTQFGIGLGFDRISVVGDISFGGTLKLTVDDPLALSHGMTFDLFDWGGTATGSFLDFQLPELSEGNHWNLDNLYVDGTIQVAPEPETWILMFVAGAVILGFRKRI
jgi:autotransporter-associated beta strand protein